MFFTPEIYNYEMYNPELLKIIERDNEDADSLISKETLEKLFDGALIFITIAIIPYIIFGWLKALTTMYWNLLTPGRQWYEILVTAMTVAVIILGKLVFDELTNMINRRFDCLKDAYENKIKILKKESDAKDDKIADLEKKVNGPNNANNSKIFEHDINVINN